MGSDFMKYVTSLTVCHSGVTDWKIKSRWFPVASIAYHSYQILWKCAKPFSGYVYRISDWWYFWWWHYHEGSWVMTSQMIIHHIPLSIHHPTVTDCRKLKNMRWTSLQWPNLDKILCISIKPFSSYVTESMVHMVTDRWQDNSGWKMQMTEHTHKVYFAYDRA